MTYFSVEHLTLTFGGLKAVNDVSFSVESGEVFALIGPNGAGKSTIFNIISRFYTPQTGSVNFKGQELLSLPAHDIAKAGIARTFQNIELFEGSTVLENLLVGRHSEMPHNWVAEFFHLPSVRKTERLQRRKIEEILDLLDLQHLRYKQVSELAYGERKNVELARALCSEPELLLLDEPASGLNPEETVDMSFWLSDINKLLGVTIIMVEHDMNLVSRVADRVLALGNGEVMAMGSVEEVQANEKVQSAYLGGAV